MTVPLVATQRSAERYEVYYDDSGYYGYVMVGTRASRRPLTTADIDAVKERLRAGGVQPVMAGTSYRPADDGKQYDYYIRVLRNGDKSDRQTVLTALQPNAPAVTPSSPPQVTHPLQEVTEAHDNYCRKCGAPVRGVTHPLQEVIEALEQERLEKQALQQRLQQADALNAELNAEMPRITGRVSALEVQLQQAETVNAEARSVNIELENKNARLMSDISEITSRVPSGETQQTEYNQLLEYQEQRVRNLQAELDDTQSMLNTARTDLSDALGERDHYRAELTKLRAEYDVLPIARDAPRVNRRIPEKEFEKLIDCLLPEIELMRGSISVMLTEVRDYKDALHTLKQITTGDVKPHCKVQKVKSRTWWEYRYSTGRRKDGRIYATKTKDRKHRVLVGTKDTQDLDYARLEAACP